MGKESLRNKAYEILRNKILDGTYPPNKFLNEQMLSDELSISRTPIHDALVRLQENNFVTIFPKKGVIVTEITPQLVSSIYEIRILLEPYILSYYGNLLEIKEFERLYNKIQENPIDIQTEFNFDSNFHKLIYQYCPNIFISKMLKESSDQNTRIRFFSGTAKERLIESRKEHLSILNEIINYNFDTAAEKLQKHLYNAKQDALNNLIEKWR